MDAASTFGTHLQRVVSLSTLEASEYERAQRLNLLQPALDYVRQLSGQQHPGAVSQTPQRANVLLRPLAASTAPEQAAADGVQQTPATTAATDGDAFKSAVQSAVATSAAGSVLPTPLLMTPAAALLHTPAANGSWTALGLNSAMALAAGGVRPVAAFPHFLSGMMATPLVQHSRATRPGEQQQQADQDDGKTSKKRQGYHIEPAALQKLIEKQQLEAQRRQQEQQLHSASADATKAAAEPATDACDEPPPRQQQQQHRPRVLSRLPPQVREQAERHAAERALKQAELLLQQELEGAGDSTREAAGSSSSRQQAAAAGGALPGAPLTAADCLGSPGSSLEGLPLSGVHGVLDSQAPALELDLDAAKMFGSAQKRLRLSLCDDHGAFLPGDTPLISPVAMPTPAAAPGPDVSGVAGTAAAAAAGNTTPAAAAAAEGDSTAGVTAAAAVTPASAEAPTPSKFFSGSPVPQAQRRAAGDRPPDTPVVLVNGPTPPRKQEVAEGLRGGQGVQGLDTAAPLAEGGSGWVPVPGQAPAVPGATALPSAAVGAAGSGGDGGNDMVLDAAAAAALPVPESPVRQVEAVKGAVLQQDQQAVGGGVAEGGMALLTPQAQEHQGAATPMTGLS